MRYINETRFNRYCSMGNRLLKPGCSTHEMPDFADFLDKLASGARQGVRILLSARDLKALDAFSACVGRKGMQPPVRKTDVYGQNEEWYKAKQKLVSAMIREHEASEERINAESNFILPDGRPVGKEEASGASALSVKEGTVVEPRIVDRPQSPLDILAHNAKVSTDRAQVHPLVGKAAVAARKGTPGMPNLPGIEKQMENLAAEKVMADSVKSGITPVMTSDMLSSGAARNYNRK